MAYTPTNPTPATWDKLATALAAPSGAAGASSLTRSDLILLYTVVTSRVAMLALNPDMPEDAAYRQSLVNLSTTLEGMVKAIDARSAA